MRFILIKHDITTIGTVTLDTFLDLAEVCYQKNPNKKVNYYCFPVGGKVPINNLKECFGGNAANTAVAFSRLKLKTAIITSLGKNYRSHQVIAHLRAEKIETRFIKIDPKVEVNLSYVLDWHKDKNDRVILSYHQPKNFNHLKWPKTQWIYLTSLGEYFPVITQQLPPQVKIAFNPGGYELKQGIKFLLPVLHKTQILILNQDEASLLLNLDSEPNNIDFLFWNLLKLGPRVIVITCGKTGAYAQSNISSQTFFVPSLKCQVKEVTGAGDAFASGFVAAYIKGKKILDCLRWGMLNATACIQKIGAQNGLLGLWSLNKQYKKTYK